MKQQPGSTDGEEQNVGRAWRWPEIDVWLIVTVLLALVLLALLTFELWIPHPFPH